MKKIHFIIQNKGGSGKSLAFYLIALKNEFNNTSYFIDLDSSVRTSQMQLKFLQGKTPARFAVMNLLDARAKLDRQLLFENIQDLISKEGSYEDFYMDFGSPESDQLTSLFSTDYTIEEFKQIETELGCQFKFDVIIAGGSSYKPCTNYLQKVVNLINGNFEVDIYINQGTFANFANLVEEIENYARINKKKISGIKYFGDFDETTSPHKQILFFIQEGRGMEAYKFIQKIKILKELAKL